MSSAVAELTSGGVAGAVGIVVTQPLDTIRIRLQNPVLGLSMGKPFTGIYNCATLTMRNEGIRGLFKGVASPTLTSGAMNAILFFSYDCATNTIQKLSRRTGEDLTIPQVYMAGMFSGLLSAFISGPQELIKCTAQVNLKNEGRMSEEWAILRNMVRDHGWFGAHGPCRGLFITMCRETPSFGFYFSTYEWMCRKLGKSDTVTFYAGGFAGMAAWAFIYPIDVIKTRWQTAPPGTYTSIGHCFKTIIAQEGWGILCRGFGATMARAWPQHAVVFYTYELVKGLCNSRSL